MAKEKSKGGGMPYFQRDHWEKDVPETKTANGKYASEMGAPEELKGQVDALADYAKRNKMKY